VKISRRIALKLMSLGTVLFGSKPEQAVAQDKKDAFKLTQVDDWDRSHDRVWLGANVWANPMEDWRVTDGAAECQSLGGDRNIQLLTHQLVHSQRAFAMSVDFQELTSAEEGGAGFRVGVRSELNEVRSNTFAKGGIDAGFVQGKLQLGPKATGQQLRP